jgi:hypothetical protein
MDQSTPEAIYFPPRGVIDGQWACGVWGGKFSQFHPTLLSQLESKLVFRLFFF